MTLAYRYPVHNTRFELEVKRSRFIASLARASNREECSAFIQQIREEFPGASHYCSAFIAGSPRDGAVLGGSDDGEVAGTAFRPMLNILLHSGLGEICAVVTRFYGGTKLGTGGLVRAYSQCLTEALKQVESVVKVLTLDMRLVFGFAHEAAIRRAIESFEGVVVNQDYGERVVLMIRVPHVHSALFMQMATSECKGNIDIALLHVEATETGVGNHYG